MYVLRREKRKRITHYTHTQLMGACVCVFEYISLCVVVYFWFDMLCHANNMRSYVFILWDQCWSCWGPFVVLYEYFLVLWYMVGVGLGSFVVMSGPCWVLVKQCFVISCCCDHV